MRHEGNFARNNAMKIVFKFSNDIDENLSSVKVSKGQRPTRGVCASLKP